MQNSDRLREKIGKKIDSWYSVRGDELAVCFYEFCQGNRASLKPLMGVVAELGSDVFADGGELNDDLLEEVENRIFDLIGAFSSSPGGRRLSESIERELPCRLTDIFVEAKRRWNLNYYKIAESVQVLDPANNLIAEPEFSAALESDNVPVAANIESRLQAKAIIDKLVLFARRKFRGDKNRKIAINWLRNPDKAWDIKWLASQASSSEGSTKVTLTRIRQSLARNHTLRRVGNRLILVGRGGSEGENHPAA